MELLVAMAIFAVIAAMTYQGLAAMITTRERMEQEGERLAALQMAMVLMTRDFEQLIDRPIRDEYNNPRPAMSGGVSEQGAVEFSRGGVRNPASRARSSMQRVAYRLAEHTLVREGWPGLERIPNSEPERRELVTGVKSFNLRFLDAGREWRDSWPPPGEPAATKHLLPRAVEVTLTLDDWGVITRLFLPAGQGRP